jgi:hypothetical protein
VSSMRGKSSQAGCASCANCSHIVASDVDNGLCARFLAIRASSILAFACQRSLKSWMRTWASHTRTFWAVETALDILKDTSWVSVWFWGTGIALLGAFAGEFSTVSAISCSWRFSVGLPTRFGRSGISIVRNSRYWADCRGRHKAKHEKEFYGLMMEGVLAIFGPLLPRLSKSTHKTHRRHQHNCIIRGYMRRFSGARGLCRISHEH